MVQDECTRTLLPIERAYSNKVFTYAACLCETQTADSQRTKLSTGAKVNPTGPMRQSTLVVCHEQPPVPKKAERDRRAATPDLFSLSENHLFLRGRKPELGQNQRSLGPTVTSEACERERERSTALQCITWLLDMPRKTTWRNHRT